MAKRPTIVFVTEKTDKNAVLREALAAEFKFQLVSDFDEVLSMVEAKRAMDLVITDTHKPRIFCEYCADALIGIPILIVADQFSDDDVHQLLAAGATDCLSLAGDSLFLHEARIRNHYDNKRKTDILGKVAKFDRLTSVTSRDGFNEAIDIEWRRSVREYNTLSLLLIQVDEFDSFAENYGIGVANNCLKRIAQLIDHSCLRAADLVARYDENVFICSLPGTDLQKAMLLAERILEAVASLNIKHDFAANGDRVTVSIGCSSTDPHQDGNYHELLQELEDELEQAQVEGGNQVQGIGV